MPSIGRCGRYAPSVRVSTTLGNVGDMHLESEYTQMWDNREDYTRRNIAREIHKGRYYPDMGSISSGKPYVLNLSLDGPIPLAQRLIEQTGPGYTHNNTTLQVTLEAGPLYAMGRYMLIKSRLKSGKRRYLGFVIEFSGETAVIRKTRGGRNAILFQTRLTDSFA